MWHDVSTVARTNRLPEADLVDFAIARDSKYGIVIEGGIARVSTWHTDALVADFERFQKEEDAAEAEYLANNFVHVMPDVGCEFDPKVA